MIRKIAHLGIAVKDLEAARAFIKTSWLTCTGEEGSLPEGENGFYSSRRSKY